MKTFWEHKLRRPLLFALSVFFLLIPIGCQKKLQPTLTPTEMAAEPPPKLTLGPGDVVDVKFFYAPELNETQTVRPDGKITLQLVGDVDVNGKTPAEVRDSLVQAYSQELKRPEIQVIVRSLNTRRVYVAGEVRTPGLIPVPSHLTALEAVIQAGGFNYLSADPKNIVVIREREGKYYGTVLDYAGTLEGKAGQVFYLQPKDIVYVSSTQISDVNRWIDQYINRMIPNFLEIIYSAPVGDGTISLGAGRR